MASKGRRKRADMMTGREGRRLAEKLARRFAGNAVIEMSLAGGQVLREEFGFTEEQVKDWMDKTLERAKQNREERE